MRMSSVVGALFIALMAGAAWAQFGNPGFMAPGSADALDTASALTNASDRIFARLAFSGGSDEVDLGRLAQRKTEHQGVWGFAARMVSDHGQANARLSEIMRREAISAPRITPPEQAAAMRDLEQVDGAVFDVLYMRKQVADHAKMAQLLIWEINSGQNAQLQQFASDTLPIVLDHLAMARDLLSQTEPAAQAVAAAKAGARKEN